MSSIRLAERFLRRRPRDVVFQGGGGHASIAASQAEGKPTVDLETREWDYHVKRYMGQI